MIRRNEDGLYEAKYIFRTVGANLTREMIERGITRVKTLLSSGHLYGECFYRGQINKLYHNNFIRFTTTDTRYSTIKIMAVEVIEEDDKLGIYIGFIPNMTIFNIYPDDVKGAFMNSLNQNKFVILPRMIAHRNGDIIDHMDIITFDLVAKEDVSGQEDIDTIMKRE